MIILAAFIVLPAGAALLLTFSRFIPDPARRRILSLILVFSVTAALMLISAFLLGKTGLYSFGGFLPPLGIALILDGFSAPVLFAVNFLTLICAVFSYGYINENREREKYYALMLLTAAGLNGVILAGDIFNLYIFLELAAVSSFSLLVFGASGAGIAAAFKYMAVSFTGSAFILAGIAFIYARTGNLNISYVSEILSASRKDALYYLPLALFAAGFSVKAALIPFHAWLPEAHEASPSPVSGVMSGLLMMTAGLYALIRTGYGIFGVAGNPLGGILIILGSISLMLGVLLALGEGDFRRLLAFDSISQAGYAAIGFGLATPLGITAGFFHLINHTVFKSLLLFNAGSVFQKIKQSELRNMGGLASSMPVTWVTSLVASLSVSGIPPFNGFWSKLLIVLACISSGRIVLAFWAAAGGVLTLAVFIRLQSSVFLGDKNRKSPQASDPEASMLIPMIILAACCALMGLLLLSPLREIMLEGASGVLSEEAVYSSLEAVPW